MKYINIPSLKKTLTRITEGDNTNEHRTGTAALGLARNYLPIERFAITPEQIQAFPKRRPDLAIERYISEKDEYVPHCFMEIKSLVNSNFSNAVDQLFDTLFVTVSDYGDASNNYSMFMIAMKGTRIAFYTYHSFATLLNEEGICNYKGFIPLNYLIPKEKFLEFGKDYPGIAKLYDTYLEGMNFTTDSNILN